MKNVEQQPVKPPIISIGEEARIRSISEETISKLERTTGSFERTTERMCTQLQILIDQQRDRHGAAGTATKMKDQAGVNAYAPGVVPTSAVTFLETEHGRLRRQQRGISKRDLQAAKKHGQKTTGRPRQNGETTAIYTYHGIVYIVNDCTGEEITSYTVPLKLDCVPITNIMQLEHHAAAARLKINENSWLSNTVMVIDTSGSMREGDVWGARSRLHAAWIAVALDFLAHRLETGAAGPRDVISIVALGPTAKVVIREQPSTWVLYNQLVAIYMQNEVPAYGHGPYIPSLDMAESLLTQNSNASCALALSFLSDGKPSDAACMVKSNTKVCWRDMLVTRVGELAKQFGRRLTFAAIGIGNSDDFSTLRDMVDAAADFGAISTFKLPSMTSSGIGEAFSSLATSITTTQTEMTDVQTLKQRKVRNVLRESKKMAAVPISVITPDDFALYSLRKVRRSVYKEWNEGGKRKKAFEDVPLQHLDAKFVAIHEQAFGEGAERLAFRFYEVAEDALTIVGGSMVAKESRLVHDEHADERTRKEFVRKFCETQQRARRLAAQFNKKLEKVSSIDKATPRITFLDCSIYQLNDNNFGKQSVLVEERLDESKWHKWNANNGYVEGKKTPTFTEETMNLAMKKLDEIDLNIIEEGSEEEESEEESDDGLARVVYTPSEVAQAFSHFSYLATRRKRLVCDLQGVYDEKANLLRFSDPVIHYYNHLREDRHGVHGRTDRGRKGIGMFFSTHVCGLLCGALGHSPIEGAQAERGGDWRGNPRRQGRR